MTDVNDYDDVEDPVIDDDEAKAAEKGAASSEEVVNDTDVLEAETLTVTAKQKNVRHLKMKLRLSWQAVAVLLKFQLMNPLQENNCT